jgi:hypothetical protein
MATIEYINNSIINSFGEILPITELYIETNGVFVHLENSVNNFWMVFIENETTINGILQTSAQMIFDTLSNGQS